MLPIQAVITYDEEKTMLHRVCLLVTSTWHLFAQVSKCKASKFTGSTYVIYDVSDSIFILYVKILYDFPIFFAPPPPIPFYYAISFYRRLFGLKDCFFFIFNVIQTPIHLYCPSYFYLFRIFQLFFIKETIFLCVLFFYYDVAKIKKLINFFQTKHIIQLQVIAK